MVLDADFNELFHPFNEKLFQLGPFMLSQWPSPMLTFLQFLLKSVWQFRFSSYFCAQNHWDEEKDIADIAHCQP